MPFTAAALTSAAEVDPEQERRDGERFSRMPLAPVKQIATYELVNILAGNYGSRQTIRQWQWMFDPIFTIIFSTLRHVLGRSIAILINFRRLRKRLRFSHFRSVNILTGNIVLQQVTWRQKILTRSSFTAFYRLLGRRDAIFAHWKYVYRCTDFLPAVLDTVNFIKNRCYREPAHRYKIAYN